MRLFLTILALLALLLCLNHAIQAQTVVCDEYGCRVAAPVYSNPYQSYSMPYGSGGYYASTPIYQQYATPPRRVVNRYYAPPVYIAPVYSAPVYQPYSGGFGLGFYWR